MSIPDLYGSFFIHRCVTDHDYCFHSHYELINELDINLRLPTVLFSKDHSTQSLLRTSFVPKPSLLPVRDLSSSNIVPHFPSRYLLPSDKNGTGRSTGLWSRGKLNPFRGPNTSGSSTLKPRVTSVVLLLRLGLTVVRPALTARPSIGTTRLHELSPCRELR